MKINVEVDEVLWERFTVKATGLHQNPEQWASQALKRFLLRKARTISLVKISKSKEKEEKWFLPSAPMSPPAADGTALYLVAEDVFIPLHNPLTNEDIIAIREIQAKAIAEGKIVRPEQIYPGK